jgi:hypothetical protein
MSHSSRVEHTSNLDEEDNAIETSTVAAAERGSRSKQSSSTMADQVIMEEKVSNLYE